MAMFMPPRKGNRSQGIEYKMGEVGTPPTPPERDVFLNFERRVSGINLVHMSHNSAKFYIDGQKHLIQDKYEDFLFHTGVNSYVSDYHAWRTERDIFVELNNDSPVQASVTTYFAYAYALANNQAPLAGLKFAFHANTPVTGPHFSKRPDFAIRSTLREGGRRPNFVGETQYGIYVAGEEGYHQHMQHYLANPDVIAGIVVDIQYPWNFQNHLENIVTLLYYEKNSVGQQPIAPSRVLVLGRALNLQEIQNLVATTGVAMHNIHGHGIVDPATGVVCDRCWLQNPANDDIYSFRVPGSVLMVSEFGVFEGFIGPVQVNLNNLGSHVGDVIINCKVLMRHVAQGIQAMHVQDVGVAIDVVPFLGPIVI